MGARRTAGLLEVLVLLAYRILVPKKHRLRSTCGLNNLRIHYSPLTQSHSWTSVCCMHANNERETGYEQTHGDEVGGGGGKTENGGAVKSKGFQWFRRDFLKNEQYGSKCTVLKYCSKFPATLSRGGD